MDALHRAMAEFAVTDPGLMIEPPARAAARQSLDSAGLLLLGETHGVRENPLLIRALMQAFGLTSLALEWPEDLAPAIRAFLAVTKAHAVAPWLKPCSTNARIWSASTMPVPAIAVSPKRWRMPAVPAT